MAKEDDPETGPFRQLGCVLGLERGAGCVVHQVTRLGACWGCLPQVTLERSLGLDRTDSEAARVFREKKCRSWVLQGWRSIQLWVWTCCGIRGIPFKFWLFLVSGLELE